MTMTDKGHAIDVRLELDGRALEGRVPVRLWSRRSARGPRPLLVVHDGTDYVRRAGLLRLLERTTPVRAALVEPVERDEQYAASPAYTRTLVRELLPALDSGSSRVGSAPASAHWRCCTRTAASPRAWTASSFSRVASFAAPRTRRSDAFRASGCRAETTPTSAASGHVASVTHPVPSVLKRLSAAACFPLGNSETKERT